MGLIEIEVGLPPGILSALFRDLSQTCQPMKWIVVVLDAHLGRKHY
jgi:hypothetical protein